MSGSDRLGVDLIQAVRARWRLFAAVTTVVAVLAAVYVGALPSEYQATAVVEVGPGSGEFPGSEYLALAAPGLIAHATSEQALQDVADRAGTDLRTVGEGVQASVGVGSNLISVTARVADAELAERVANEVADEMVTFAAPNDLIRAQVVSPAVVPQAPENGLRRFALIAGLAAALAVALICVYVAERRRPHVANAEGLQALLPEAPVHGLVPQLRSGGRTEPLTAAAVTFLARSYESSVMQTANATLVTASTAGEGTSTVTTLVAAALAEGGRRVLIVRMEPEDDDEDEAADKATRAVAPREGEPAIYRFPTRAVTRQRTLESLVATFLRVVKPKFDVILIDGPPVLSGSDARDLASASDDVLFVVSAGTPLERAREGALVVGSFGQKLVGLVGNRMAEGTVTARR
jgi:succinoglycan biosynthesis transport protein ExoP